jgi:hypothetical protein
MEEELIKIWQSSPNQELVKFEKSRLILDVQSAMDHFHRKVRFRDIREQAIAFITMPVFVYAAFSIPYIITKVASILIVLLGVFLVIRLHTTKRHQPCEVRETYVNYLYRTREYLLIQKRMLSSAHYWFIIPSMALVFLFLVGFIGVPGKSTSILQASIANVVVHAVVYIVAKLDVEKQFTSRLEKVDALINVIEKS